MKRRCRDSICIPFLFFNIQFYVEKIVASETKNFNDFSAIERYIIENLRQDFICDIIFV